MPLHRGFSFAERRAKISNDAKLTEQNRRRRVTMERPHFAVHEVKHIATWRMDFLPRRGNRSRGQFERSFVRAVERKLDNDTVARNIQIVEFAMHVGKSTCVDVDGLRDVLPVVLLAGGNIIKIAPVLNSAMKASTSCSSASR